MDKISSIEENIDKSNFKDELIILRKIMLSTGLDEKIKWNSPTYCFKNKNVVGIGSFKHHFGIWFFQGSLLKDEFKLLEKAQEKTKALRQMKFKSSDDINEDFIKMYILESIENFKQGKIVKPTKITSVEIPAELNSILKENKELNSAFKLLSLSKQKEYCEHISTAKQEKTKLKRIEKAIPLILQGKGIHDKYKNC